MVESGELVIREAGLDGKTPGRALSTSLSAAGCRNDRRLSKRRPASRRPGQGSHQPRQSHHQGHQGAFQKKSRDESRTFLAEGLKLVIDALDRGWTIRTLVYAKAGKGKPLVEKVAARTVAAGGLVLEVSEKVMSSITRRDNPQMVAAVFEQRWTPLKDIQPKGSETWIALDRVRDPAISAPSSARRTPPAPPASFSSATVPTHFRWKPCVPPWALCSPCRWSRPRLPIFSSGRSRWMPSGRHPSGRCRRLRTIDYKSKPVILMMGNEQSGLPDDLAQAADKLARIPRSAWPTA